MDSETDSDDIFFRENVSIEKAVGISEVEKNKTKIKFISNQNRMKFGCTLSKLEPDHKRHCKAEKLKRENCKSKFTKPGDHIDNLLHFSTHGA